MFPQPSDFQSNAAGSAWVILGQEDAQTVATGLVGVARTGDRIVMGQWDSFLRNFQRNGRNLLPPTWSFNMQTATANTGTARTRDSLAVTGQWDTVTAEAMLYLLASAGEDHLADVVAALPTAASPLFNSSLTGAVIMFGLFVTRVGTPTAPSLDDAAIQFAQRIRMPNGTVFPSIAKQVVSNEADKTWFAVYTVADGASSSLPVPPSAGGPAASAPPAVAPVQTSTSVIDPGTGIVTQPKGMSTLSKVLIGAAVIGIGYAILSSMADDDGTRANPTPRDSLSRLREYGVHLGRLNRVPESIFLERKGYSASQRSVILEAARAEHRRVYGASRAPRRRGAAPLDEVTVVRTTRTTTA